MKSFFWFQPGILILALLLVIGCGGESPAEQLTPPEQITSEAGKHLKALFDSSSPIAKNNAKVAANALEAQNYVQAVGSMQIIQSLKGLSASDRDTLNQAFESLKPELRQAADQGNEGAKQALQLLEPPAQP